MIPLQAGHQFCPPSLCHPQGQPLDGVNNLFLLEEGILQV